MARQTLTRHSCRRFSLAPPLILSAALLLGSSVHADPSAADKRNASTLALEGRRLLDAGNARAALVRFQDAHKIMRDPTTGLDVAAAFEALGQLVEARAMVYEVSRLPVQPNEPPAFRQARATAASAVEALDSRIPSLMLRIEGAPKEAVTATVDGEKVPAESLTTLLVRNPGKREVVVTAPGYRTARATVELVDGVTKPVEVPLVLEREVVAAGARSPQQKDEPTPIRNSGLIYAGIAVSGALAVVGVGTAIGAVVVENKSVDDWNDAGCTGNERDECYLHFNEQENERFLLANTAFWTFIGAAVVGGGTLAYALTSKKPEKTSPKQGVRVEPTMGGIRIRGTF